MIEPFEDWCWKVPSKLSIEEKRHLLEHKVLMKEYLEGVKNDITHLPLLEFIAVYRSGNPFVFDISALSIDTLRWMSLDDMAEDHSEMGYRSMCEDIERQAANLESKRPQPKL